MMRELGGPVDPADIPAVHRERVESVATGEWWFVIVPEPSGSPAGTIGIWDSSFRDSPRPRDRLDGAARVPAARHRERGARHDRRPRTGGTAVCPNPRLPRRLQRAVELAVHA